MPERLTSTLPKSSTELKAEELRKKIREIAGPGTVGEDKLEVIAGLEKQVSRLIKINTLLIEAKAFLSEIRLQKGLHDGAKELSDRISSLEEKLTDKEEEELRDTMKRINGVSSE